jgi:hypothetical protein
VTDEPGLRPKSPNIVVGPVLVTVEPPSTEKLADVPRPTVAVAPRALLAKNRVDSNPSDKSPIRNVFLPAREDGRSATSREPPSSNPRDCGTPLFMGVS